MLPETTAAIQKQCYRLHASRNCVVAEITAGDDFWALPSCTKAQPVTHHKQCATRSIACVGFLTSSIAGSTDSWLAPLQTQTGLGSQQTCMQVIVWKQDVLDADLCSH